MSMSSSNAHATLEMPPSSLPGCLRNVGWKSSFLATVSNMSRMKSGPASSGGSNSCRLATCIGCSRDSPMRNIASVGEISFMNVTLPTSRPAHSVQPQCGPEKLPAGKLRWEREVLVTVPKFIDIHGEQFAVLDEGQGEALLLIHGMAGSSQTWRAILPQLAKKYRVIAPDLLGHGQSSKPRGDYSLGAFAVSLRDLLDELGVAQATVVGHSLGGGVAMQFFYQHPDYCRRLVLIASGGLGTDVGLILRVLSAPGAELVLPIIAPRPVLEVGNKVRSWLSSAGIRSPRGAEIWNSYSSLSDRQTRH